MAYEIVVNAKKKQQQNISQHGNQSKLNYLHDWFLYGLEFSNNFYVNTYYVQCI